MEAEIELLTPLPAHCYDVYVYDWEEDGTMGELAIPVSTAVWNDSCSTHTPPPTAASGMQLIPCAVIQTLCGCIIYVTV